MLRLLQAICWASFLAASASASGASYPDLGDRSGALPEEILLRYPDSRPADTVVFEGNHYKVFIDEDRELTWHQKKALCERMGGHLAVIETEREQAFIVKLADDRYLSLGASDEEEESVWQWVNGAPWRNESAHWFDDQPNNYADEEHYLATFDDGLWVDVAAGGWDWWLPQGFICEWEGTAESNEPR